MREIGFYSITRSGKHIIKIKTNTSLNQNAKLNKNTLQRQRIISR